MLWKYYCQISSDLVVPIARYGNLKWRVKKRGFQAANREYYIAKCVYAIVKMTKHLLPAIKELSGDYFTFQQDSAPAHRAKETVELLSRETPDFITPLQWPPNSPD